MAENLDGGLAPQTDSVTRNLAIQLIRHMGVKRALHTCRQNNWQSILAMIQIMTPESKIKH